jgi:glycosyltransferase involved in cell wall biosynthesis
MDIFALTSDTEQMPFSVIEAMAAGLPIVSFNVGDVPLMVAQENATMACVPSRDDESFFEYVLDLADHAELRQQIGEANRAKAAALFDENAMASAYAELFG